MNPISAAIAGYKAVEFGFDVWYGKHNDHIINALSYISSFEKSNYSDMDTLSKAISILEQIPLDEKDYILAARCYWLAYCYIFIDLTDMSFQCLDIVDSIEIGTFTACPDVIREYQNNSIELRNAIIEAINNSTDEYSDYEEVKPKKPKKKRVNYKTIYDKHINNYIQNTESVSSSIDSIQSFVQATLELASADSNATRKQGYYCALADACIGYVLSTEDEQEAKECAAYVESALGDLMEHVGMDNVCDQVFAFYCIFCILNQDTNDKESLEQIKSIDELFPLEPLSPISDLPFQVNDAVIGIYTVIKEDALFAFVNAMYENKQYIACQDGVNELEKLQTDGAIIWTNVFRSNFYYFGHGVPQDYQKAYEYSKKAAEYYDLNSDIDSSNRAHLGWVTALNALGYCYATGLGTSIDYDLAYKYIKRSADAGNPDALSSLGEMYMKGLAVPQDTTQARSCFRQALDGGDDSAQEFMDYLNGRTDKMPGLMKCDIAAASKSIPERITVPSSSESEYLAEYTEMLEDYGEIGFRERKQLEKLRVRLGLSESDVYRLETSFSSSSLTAEEQEYIEEYKEMLEDYGEITPRERKRLEKLQQRLGLSTGRCVELEKM